MPSTRSGRSQTRPRWKARPATSTRSRRSRTLSAELAGGHRSATPFSLFVGVNTAFVLLGVLLSLLVLLILWLSGNL